MKPLTEISTMQSRSASTQLPLRDIGIGGWIWDLAGIVIPGISALSEVHPIRGSCQVNSCPKFCLALKSQFRIQ